MSVHLKDEDLIDLLDGGGGTAGRTHAAACAACAARLDELRETFSLARRAEVPEPSPLFWEVFRKGVHRRIAEERRRSAWSWSWLLPLAAAAAVVLLVARPRPANVPETAVSVERLPAWSALPPSEEDESLTVLEAVARDDGDLLGWDEGRGLGSFVASLNEEESQVLSESLREREKGGEL